MKTTTYALAMLDQHGAQLIETTIRWCTGDELDRFLKSSDPEVRRIASEELTRRRAACNLLSQ